MKTTLRTRRESPDAAPEEAGFEEARLLLRAAGHDLRGSLNIFDLSLQLLTGSVGMPLTAQRRDRVLGRMQNQVAEMTRLLDRLGDAGLALDGALAGEAQSADLSVVVADLVASAGDAVHFSNEAPGPLVGTWDLARVRRVVGVLLDVAPPVCARLRRVRRTARFEVSSPGPLSAEASAALHTAELTAVLRAGRLGAPLDLWLAREGARALGGCLEVYARGDEVRYVLDLPLDRADGVSTSDASG